MKARMSFLFAGLLAAVFLMVFAGAGYSAQSQDALLDLLPADTLICFRINNFSGTFEQLDQYLAGVSPMPVSMLLTTQLGSAIGDPLLNGMNKAGTLAAVLLPGADEEEPMGAVLLPAADVQLFLSSPYCNVDERGLYTLTPPGSSVGPVSFVPLEGSSYLLMVPLYQRGTLVSIQACLKDKKQSLSQRLKAEDAQRSASAPFWLWLNVEKGYGMLAPELRESIESGVEESFQHSPMAMEPNAVTALLDEIDFWMGQVDSFTVALTPQAEQLTAEMIFAAKTGSELAGLLVREPGMKSGFAMGGYLDPQAPLNCLMRTNTLLMMKANKVGMELWTAVLTKGQPDAALTTQINELIEKSMRAVGTEMAFSFGYQAGMPPFSVQEVVEVKDAAAVREVIRSSVDLVNVLYSKMTFPAVFRLQEKVSEYKGIPIDQVVIQFTPTDSFPAEEKAVLDALYGQEGLKYPFAITEKAIFVAVGPQAEAELKKLLDLKDNLPPTPMEMQIAMKLIPQSQSADTIASLNVLRLVKGFGGMMATMQKGIDPDSPVPPFASIAEQIPAASQSALAIGMHIDGGCVQSHVVLPKQHLMEIMSWFMQIQQKMMMEQFQQQQQQQLQQQQQQQSESGEGEGAL
ncbi:MAG TPA: hypothetical protein PLP49_01860 [Anaerohalosphaeraceae bacterium]|nr:hypothetical protein [Anaerohalosphaeraceae bacterium]HPB92818.1 hypothetical protein [Anaerohalosphaeraceae bacterium]HRT23173.1 hypothetical protein [Anaerohalosphaeraceae bacterium]